MTGADCDDGSPGVMRDAFEQRKAEIRAMDDPARAIRALAALPDELKQFSAEAGRLRTELARHLRESEGLTIRQLAGRLGISKGATQILLEREARAQRPKRRRVRQPPDVP